LRRRLILGATYLLLIVVIGLAVPFGATLSRRLTSDLGGRVEREAFAVAAAVAHHLPAALGGPLLRAAEVAYAQSMSDVLVVTAGLLVAGAVLMTLFLPARAPQVEQPAASIGTEVATA